MRSICDIPAPLLNDFSPQSGGKTFATPAPAAPWQVERFAVVRGYPPVHAVKEALRDPVVQRDDAVSASVPLRKARVRTGKAAAPGLRSGGDVTVGAVQLGADVRFHEPARLRDERVTSCDRLPNGPRRKRPRIVERCIVARGAARTGGKRERHEGRKRVLLHSGVRYAYR